MPQVHELTDVSMKELSLVFAQKDGKEWAPRNPEARVLGTKAGQKKPGLMQILKAYFASDDSFQWPVSIEVQDDVDHDGDGADDYNNIATALCRVAWDLQTAYGIAEDSARAAAIKGAIDCFITEFKQCIGGDDDAEKAGARHSKADRDHLDAIKAAHKAMGEHLDALTSEAKDDKPAADDDEEEENEADKALALLAPGDVGEDGLPANSAVFDALSAKAKKKDAGKGKKPYGDVEYADPGYQEDGKKRYPLDTEEHVRSAASYFGKQKNRDKYSAEQQKEIQAKIDAAEKKFGIGEKDDDGKKAGEVDVTAEQIQAMIDAAVTKAVATTKAAADDQIAAAKAEAEKAQADAAAAKAQADAAAATLAAASLKAAQPTAPSGAQPVVKSRLEEVLKAQLKLSPESTRF